VLSQLGQPLQVLHNSGALFGAGVPLFERPGLIRSRELGDEVAAALGSARAMLLRGHGANIAEADVRLAVVVACFLEEAADLQVKALAAAGGRAEAVRFYTPEETERVREQLDNPGPLTRAWEYYVALASAAQPAARISSVKV
jgi:HCOMODA/2-hydroxy-3-carboxy-muconic semialdehyde decarboxylase